MPEPVASVVVRTEAVLLEAACEEQPEAQFFPKKNENLWRSMMQNRQNGKLLQKSVQD